jgi:hypothetical protein
MNHLTSYAYQACGPTTFTATALFGCSDVRDAAMAASESEAASYFFVEGGRYMAVML